MLKRGTLTKITTIAIAVLLTAAVARAQDAAQPAPPSAGPTKLAVLWTSGDAEVALKMCLMYAHVAKTQGWFSEVLLIVWGPSQRLLAADQAVRDKVMAMKKDGVAVNICIACAGMYGLVDQFKAMGLEVKGMGGPLTEYLKSPDWAVATF